MRILLVSEDIPYPAMGGLAKHVLNLARALVQAGHQVDLLGGDQHPITVAGDEANFGGRFFGELNGHTRNWKEVRFGMLNPVRRTWVAKRFARIILQRAKDYDAIHYHGHWPNVAKYIPSDVNFLQTRHDHGSDCVMQTRFRNNTICHSTSASDCASCRAEGNPNLIQQTITTAAVKIFRKEVAEGFRRHKTIFVSDMLQRNFARTAGERQWGKTIHNFVDIEKIKTARSTAKLLPITDDIQVFLSGKLYSAKGIEEFLKTLAPQLPANMYVTIAGDGDDLARLRAQYENNQIRFLGWCTAEKTLSFAAQSHVIVVPSLWEEPCATTCLEGILLGKPTLALARGGTPELMIYAASSEQLRLHPDMKSLVHDLITLKSFPTYDLPPEEICSANHIVQELVEAYQLPFSNFTACTIG
jgi:glycogen(starch) synthase